MQRDDERQQGPPSKSVPEPEGNAEKPRRRQFGGMRGQIWISDDFDDPLPHHLLAAFCQGKSWPQDG